ncbi:MAG: tyrosine-type recombinase/integrase [Candidatus Thermoplasmatota archaeon]|nr:tyrosine-type recombinase/integrase [Candidatus Thermoplasmatota archaeon]
MGRVIHTDSLSELAKEFIDEYHLIGASECTVKNYANTLRRIERTLETPMEKLDIRRFFKWLLEQDISYYYARSYFNTAKSFYRWAHNTYEKESYLQKYRRVKKSEKKYFKFKTAPRKTKRVLSPEEARELLNKATLRDRFSLMLLLKTGIRTIEAFNIQLKDISIEEYHTRIALKSHAKRNKEKGDNCVVFLDEEGTDLLQNYLNYYYAPRTTYKDYRELLENVPEYYLLCNHHIMGERLGYPEVITTRIARFIQRIEKKEGKGEYDGFSPHACRWTFTNWLRRNKCDYLILKALRGDSGDYIVNDGMKNPQENLDMVEYYSDIEEQEILEEYLRTIPVIGCKPL